MDNGSKTVLLTDNELTLLINTLAGYESPKHEQLRAKLFDCFMPEADENLRALVLGERDGQ